MPGLPDPANLAFFEDLRADYRRDPHAIPEAWRSYFDNTPPHAPEGGEAGAAALHDRVVQLVRAYRVRGHLKAKLDPLGIPRPPPPEIEPSHWGLRETDLDRTFSSALIHTERRLTLRELIASLERTYCGAIGVQYMHIDDPAVRKWLEERLEKDENQPHLSRDEQLLVLTRLTKAVTLEEFIQKKYLGAKSFSLEGSESLIPLLTLAIERSADDGIDEIVLAMPHRGRLNVLANVIGKNAAEIFYEFEDRESMPGHGDVKYHVGYSNDWVSAKGQRVHLSLCFNPSHLEFVNPVALGRLRAKQDRHGDAERRRGMAILMHGDAAFAGEGVVQETLNLSQLDGYRTGGTLHVIVNNQIGFTTSPREGRSTPYATDVAKLLQIPIFHVNGEDPEAVLQALHVAMAFRREMQRDVVIDMYGYRRWGHNEGDEPEFTQPLMVRAIKARPSVRDGYLAHLLKLGGVTEAEADRIQAECRSALEADLVAARSPSFKPSGQAKEGGRLQGIWRGYAGGRDDNDAPDTGVAAARLRELLVRQTELPGDFTPHSKIQRLLGQRREMAEGARPLDWGAAEALAFATLAVDGARVRLSGQDSERGTFSHRHAVLHDYQDGKRYMPLSHLAADQAPVEIYNSPLSETGVLGFDYGYSLDMPEALVLWEAQFGDFGNAGQVIIDQFIASAEDKWRRLSGLVLLLPHGFEGMGPEHSSARLERFLTLCAKDNMQVAVPTTPAQYFHVLRRQVVRRARKPLVVLTPKSLLRHPQSTSPLDALATGGFARVIPDFEVPNPARVILCSGKVYFDLLDRRPPTHACALVRVEQLYPFPERELTAAVADSRAPLLWVQEEPSNMGAWPSLRARFGDTLLGRPFTAVCRDESASPATGSLKTHKIEQEQLCQRAFAS